MGSTASGWSSSGSTSTSTSSGTNPNGGAEFGLYAGQALGLGSSSSYAGTFSPFGSSKFPGSQSPPPNEWEFHTKYGVIHRCTCATCREYVRHLAPFWSSINNHKSLQSTKPLYDAFYRDGLREGVAFGNAQLVGLQNEVQRAVVDRENVLCRAGELERDVKVLRERNAELEREVGELKAKLSEAAADAAKAKAMASDVWRNGQGAQQSKVGPAVAAAAAPPVPLSSQPAPTSFPQQSIWGPPAKEPLYSSNPNSTTASVKPQAPATMRQTSVALPTKPLSSSTTKPAAPPSYASVIGPKTTSAHTHRSHLSQSTIASEDSRDDLPKTNPRLEDSVEVWYDYYCTHQKSWPRGVRCDARRRPILSDLRADRAVARFRPDIALSQRIGLEASAQAQLNLDPEGNVLPSPSPRNQFKNMIVELFSQPGLYASKLYEMRVVVAPKVTYERYEGPFPVTMESLVRFLARSGVTQKMAAEDFEPWGQNFAAGVNCSIPFIPNSALPKPRRR